MVTTTKYMILFLFGVLIPLFASFRFVILFFINNHNKNQLE